MYSEALRPFALQFCKAGFSFRKIASITGIGKSTLQRWASLGSKERRGRLPRLPGSDEFTNTLLGLVEGNPFDSVRGYARGMRLLGFAASNTTTFRKLKLAGFGNVRTYPGGLPGQRLLGLREAFTNSVRHIDPSEVIAIDESSFYKAGVPRRAWATAGARVRVPLVRTTGRRHSLVVALTQESVASHWLLPGSFNGESFANFILRLPELPGKRYVLMDNVAFHKSRTVRAALSAKGLVPLYTSPYSPEWNPVEMLFSRVKRAHNSAPPTESVEQAVELQLRQVSADLCSAWFRHCFDDIRRNYHR